MILMHCVVVCQRRRWPSRREESRGLPGAWQEGQNDPWTLSSASRIWQSLRPMSQFPEIEE